MKINYLLLLFTLLNLFIHCEEPKESIYPNDAVRMSQDFIIAIKTGQDFQQYKDTLAEIDLSKLKDELENADQKLAFWINTYNSLVQAKIREDVKAFENKDDFFMRKDQVIGGLNMSLDEIENGILRRKTSDENKDFFEKFRVDELDPRIHFTLNCGATSCPPVAYYSVENLNTELELAKESYVTQTSIYDENSNVVELSELFDWFHDDFGGNEGVLILLKELEIIPQDSNPEIIYAPYDWQLDIENY